MSFSIASEFLFFNHPNTFLRRNLRPLKEWMTSALGVPLNFEPLKGPFKRRHQHSGEPLSESPPQSWGSSKPAGFVEAPMSPCGLAVASPGGGSEDGWAQGWGSDRLPSPSLPRNPFNRFGSRFLNQARVCLCDLLLHLRTLSRDLRRWRGLLCRWPTAEWPRGGAKLSPGGWGWFPHPSLTTPSGAFVKFWTSGVGSLELLVGWPAEGRRCAECLGAAL